MPLPGTLLVRSSVCGMILAAARRHPLEGQVYFLAFHKCCTWCTPKAGSSRPQPSRGWDSFIPVPDWGHALGPQWVGRWQTPLQLGSAGAPGGQ